jgi:hypothetical protein
MDESFHMDGIQHIDAILTWMKLNNMENFHLDENEHMDDEDNTWMKLNDTNIVDHMVEH